MAYPVSVSQEIPATAEGLIRIAVFAAIAFFIFSLFVDGTVRLFTLGLGGAILLAIAAWIGVIARQRRYGTAVLYAVRKFEPGQTFEGVIDVALGTPPSKPIRLRVHAWKLRTSAYTVARERVDPLFLRPTARGTSEIPFRMDIPAMGRSSEVRLSARTASWPVGWGATFLIREWH